MISGLKLSEKATTDIDMIWSFTVRRYDMDQADAYDTLLWQALRDVRDDPLRPSSLARSELGTHMRSYHIDLSKYRSRTGIKSPRHVIYYNVNRDGTVSVIRILHDTMKASEHLHEF